MGMLGKPEGLCGSDVETYFRDGRIKEIAAYCESDVINTYRLWLRHELFRGGLDQLSYEESELRLRGFLDARQSRPPPYLSNEAVGESLSPPTC
jgi:predicted PolB exonuclease-like 3'-5' exonuclease